MAKIQLPTFLDIFGKNPTTYSFRIFSAKNPIINNFTGRPWVAGGTLSEGDESEEENVEKLQGIIRSLL